MTEQEKWRSDLSNADAEVRALAAENLCHAGADAAPAVVELVKACGDEEAVQIWAVAALEQLDAPPVETAASLSKLVEAPDELVAYWAITLLGRLGPAAVDSEGVLVEALLYSQDLAVKERAAWALGKIGAESEPAINALNQAASSEQARLARMAQGALAQ